VVRVGLLQRGFFLATLIILPLQLLFFRLKPPGEQAVKKLTEAENRNSAERIRWYLEANGIEAWLDEEDQEDVTVWILSEEQAEKARSLIPQALSEDRAQEVSALIRERQQLDRQKQKDAAKEQKRRAARQNESGFWQFPVTYGLLIISATIFLFNEFFDKQQIIYRLFFFSENPYSRLWAFKNFDEILAGQIWRLVTPAFLHFGWFHIAFNSLWCIQVGRLTESLMPTRRYIAMLLTVAVVSHLSFYLVSGPVFGGLSGVIYAYVGYLWGLERFGNVSTGLEERTGQFFLIWYIICLGLSLTGFMAIANTIHGMGGLVGIIFAILATGSSSQITKKIRFNKAFAKEAGIGLLLLVAGMLVDHFF